MKRIITILACVLALIPFITQCAGGGDARIEGQSSADAFASFAQHFSSSSAFATAIVGGYKVLLVSQEVFGELECPDLEAVEATVFALDSVGGIVSLGSVRSQGSNYPVSLLDGKLMVAGHQFVEVYDIRGEQPSLVLHKYVSGEGPVVDAMFDTFEMAEPIIFHMEL